MKATQRCHCMAHSVSTSSSSFKSRLYGRLRVWGLVHGPNSTYPWRTYSEGSTQPRPDTLQCVKSELLLHTVSLNNPSFRDFIVCLSNMNGNLWFILGYIYMYIYIYIYIDRYSHNDCRRWGNPIQTPKRDPRLLLETLNPINLHKPP